MKPLYHNLIFILIILSACTSGYDVSYSSLLKEMGDPNSLSYYPDPEYKLKQFSSYDRRSDPDVDQEWFANHQ